jgi:hypothetical protein
MLRQPPPWSAPAGRVSLVAAIPMSRRTATKTSGRETRAGRDGEGLLAEIVSAADRDHCPGARPVVSVREQEEPGYLRAVEARALFRVSLSRRGIWHGEWAELDPRKLPAPPDSGRKISTELTARWHASQPIVIHGAADGALADSADCIDAAGALHAALQEPLGLRRWLARLAKSLEPDFAVLPARPRLFDPGRDLERVLVGSVAAGGRGRRVKDLWVKSAWLSTAEGDDSLRVRVSFGRERDDDASGDLLRHRLVAELASRILPESSLVSANPALVHQVERMIAEPALFTQHIAYWNAPDGGALFHHDAFSEDEEESRRPGQLGVCYLQLSGRTAWLALSIADLAARVREFAECLSEGEIPWVRAQLFPDAASQKRFAGLLEDEEALLRELARPSCGSLAAFVNRGPEFTAWLADAGHGAILSPGDAILLPNHGLARTAMHSVFCASEEVAYGLSLAIRADREEPAEWILPQGPARGPRSRRRTR